MLIPTNYTTAIVQGSTILDIKVYLTIRLEATFMVKLNYDNGGDDDGGEVFDFEMHDGFVPSWRGRLSRMISELGPSEPRRAELREWEETMYYHFDSIIQRLRLPKSKDYRMGVTFDVELTQTSQQALENLGLTVSGSDSNNLLKRVECDEGDCAICFEEFKESSTKELTCMPCSHTFHYSLPKHETCPLCRYKLNWRTVDDLPVDDLPSPFEDDDY